MQIGKKSLLGVRFRATGWVGITVGRKVATIGRVGIAVGREVTSTGRVGITVKREGAASAMKTSLFPGMQLNQGKRQILG